MKTINVTFEDKEHEDLQRKKGKKSWHDWIIELSKSKNDEMVERKYVGRTYYDK